MSENKPSDVKIEEKPQGTVSFATDVIATIAGLAATEVEGVASMNNTSTGIADRFSRKATKNFTKGVHIELVDGQVDVAITIIVDFGSPIPEVARGIQENVRKAIETMAGLTVRSINIHVAGISFEKEMEAARELDEQQKKMLKPEETSPAPKEDHEAETNEEPAEDTSTEFHAKESYEEQPDNEDDEKEPEIEDDEPEPNNEEDDDADEVTGIDEDAKDDTVDDNTANENDSDVSDVKEESDDPVDNEAQTEYIETEIQLSTEPGSEEPESEFEFDTPLEDGIEAVEDLTEETAAKMDESDDEDVDKE